MLSRAGLGPQVEQRVRQGVETGAVSLAKLRRDWARQPIYDLYAIAAVNCVVCWLWSCRRWPGEGWMRRHWTVSRRNLRAGRLHTLVTAAFSHEDAYHLFHSKDSKTVCHHAVV